MLYTVLEDLYRTVLSVNNTLLAESEKFQPPLFSKRHTFSNHNAYDNHGAYDAQAKCQLDVSLEGGRLFLVNVMRKTEVSNMYGNNLPTVMDSTRLRVDNYFIDENGK
jgi:hypothetical protein